MTGLRRRLAGALAALWLLAPGAAAAAEPSAEPRVGTAAAGADLAARIAGAVREAALVSGLPAPWIEAVMAAESGGDPRAISRAGALGLMQLMPATWRMLRARLGLGADPFDVRDNVLAGAAYLREMHDRFGAPGFLAAYNAGPERYAQHLAGRRPLPAETRAYLAKLGPRLAAAAGGPEPPRPWTMAPLFASRAQGAPAGDLFALRDPSPSPQEAAP